MKRDEVKIYEGHPALNVKDHGGPDLDREAIAAKFGCSLDQAQLALNFAYENAVMRFWDDARSIAKEVFEDDDIKVWQYGRSGGLLCVEGLADVDEWVQADLTKWQTFEDRIKSSIKFYKSSEQLIETIDVNGWWQEGSELYNIIDGKDGKPMFISERKAEAIKAGFGPVVR